MTIILFLVDTSASMSQRTYLGARPTLLDVAKDAIEKFLKVSFNFLFDRSFRTSINYVIILSSCVRRMPRREVTGTCYLLSKIHRLMLR